MTECYESMDQQWQDNRRACAGSIHANASKGLTGLDPGECGSAEKEWLESFIKMIHENGPSSGRPEGV